MHVWRDTSCGDRGGAEELVELLIVAECDLEVARCDRALLLFLSGTACELNYLTSDVLKGSGHEYTSTLADPVRDAFLLDQPVEATNREDEVDL